MSTGMVLRERRKIEKVSTAVTVYRIMQNAVFDVLWKHYGLSKAYEYIRDAGNQAGAEYARSMLKLDLSFRAFIAELQDSLGQLSGGIFCIESFDAGSYNISLTVKHLLSSSGTAITNGSIGAYDEGFIAGIMEAFTGVRYKVYAHEYKTDEGRIGRFTCEAMVPPLVTAV